MMMMSKLMIDDDEDKADDGDAADEVDDGDKYGDANDERR